MVLCEYPRPPVNHRNDADLDFFSLYRTRTSLQHIRESGLLPRHLQYPPDLLLGLHVAHPHRHNILCILQ